MLAYLWVAIGGALGSVGRFWLSNLISSPTGESFPLSTILVNVSGSFLIGVLAALTHSEGRLSPEMRDVTRQFLMIGICGGYTTFSSFSLQTLELLRARAWLYAGGNVLGSVALCLIAVSLGYWLGAALFSMKGS